MDSEAIFASRSIYGYHGADIDIKIKIKIKTQQLLVRCEGEGASTGTMLVAGALGVDRRLRLK